MAKRRRRPHKARTTTLLQSDVIRMVQLLEEVQYPSSALASYPSDRRMFDVVERALFVLGHTVKLTPGTVQVFK